MSALSPASKNPQLAVYTGSNLKQTKQTVDNVVSRHKFSKIFEAKQVAKDGEIAAQGGRRTQIHWQYVHHLVRPRNILLTGCHVFQLVQMWCTQSVRCACRMSAHLEYMKKRAIIQVIIVTTWTCKFGMACRMLLAMLRPLMVPSVMPYPCDQGRNFLAGKYIII